MKKIDSRISGKFAKGLAVFTGKSAFTKITRGKFEMVSSVIDDGDVYYIDQWFPGHLGGGQEILEVAKENTRACMPAGRLRILFCSDSVLRKMT